MCTIVSCVCLALCCSEGCVNENGVARGVDVSRTPVTAQKSGKRSLLQASTRWKLGDECVYVCVSECVCLCLCQCHMRACVVFEICCHICSNSFGSQSACSVAASYKPPMLVTRVRLPACAHCGIEWWCSYTIFSFRCDTGKHDTEGIRTPAGRAQWISSPSP